MRVVAPSSTTVLDERTWRSRRDAHEARVRTWTDPHQARVSRGEKHPVYDFLFSYYAFRPAWLRRWHPGPDVMLTGESAREFLRWSEYRDLGSAPTNDHEKSRVSCHGPTVVLDIAGLSPKRRDFVVWLRDLLVAMRERPAFFGCFGLHEWAMVYRQTSDQVRHNAYPLRFPPNELAEIVERSAICCSHFDAFRFFTEPARLLNKLQPTREDVPRMEQRGCLHANMDLYKWAAKTMPWTGSALLLECFTLALELRDLDMKASPYDLAKWGLPPIRIETPEGRREYEKEQRRLAEKAAALRKKLIATLQATLS